MQLFDDDWLSYSVGRSPDVIGEKLLWRISDDVVIPTDSPESSIIRAVSKMQLGRRPVVALSGGADSQAACLALRIAGVGVNAVTMEYNDGLNAPDVNSAREFCDLHNIPHQVFQINIIDFLKRRLPDIAVRYQCSSPQFNAHFAFYEAIQFVLSPTSIIAGGQFPFFSSHKNRLVYLNSDAQNAWTRFSSTNLFNLYGNFLGWSSDIALPLAIACGPMSDEAPKNHEAVDSWKKEVYDRKIAGMRRCGLWVSPQDMNHTGFEDVKKYFEAETGDVIAFEKHFRSPYEQLYPNHQGYLIKPRIEEALKTFLNK